jgi:hypothetical protein
MLVTWLQSSQIEPVAPRDHGVVRSRWWDLAMRWSTVNRVLNEHLPSVASLLKGVQIECDKIVKEVAFHLASEDV